nr:TonB-dependent receptor [Gemmatimonadota bacterium]
MIVAELNRSLLRVGTLLLASVGLLASPLVGQAATGVAGRVTDAASGAPLPAARVWLVEQPHRVESTHEDGAFSFLRLGPGRYTLVVERLGYGQFTRQITVRAGSVEQVLVAISPAAVNLDAVVVTGTVGGRRGQEVLSPTSVLSGAELDRQLDITVAATLQNTPGVAVTSIGPATARPVIRGLSGDRILVLEDGQRPGDLSSTSGDHAVAIDPSTARQIEVVRGPMSLLYGSSALGGVVNVVRDEIPTAVPEHVHGAATVQGTSVNRGTSMGAYASTGVGRFALRAEGSARDWNDVRTPLGPMRNTSAQTLGLAAGGAYIGEQGHAGGSYRFYDSDYGIPAGEYLGGHARGVDIAMRRHSLRTEAEIHDRGLLSSLRATGTYTDYQHTEREKSGGVGTFFAQDLAVGEVVARHDARGVLTQGAAGIRAQYRNITTGGSLRTPSTYDYSLAGFAVEEFGRGALRLQAGARYDWTRFVPREAAVVRIGDEEIPVRERTFGSMSGSLGLLYAVREDVRLGASVARAFRTPDLNELYSNGPHLAAGTYDIGDPNLRAESGLGLDVFARLNRERIRGEVALFRNNLGDFIDRSTRGRVIGVGAAPLAQYTNVDARFTGFEADVDWNVVTRVTLAGTVSYVRARFTSPRDSIGLPNETFTDTTYILESRYPERIPPLNGRVAARYDLPRYFAEASARFAARQE